MGLAHACPLKPLSRGPALLSSPWPIEEPRAGLWGSVSHSGWPPPTALLLCTPLALGDPTSTWKGFCFVLFAPLDTLECSGHLSLYGRVSRYPVCLEGDLGPAAEVAHAVPITGLLLSSLPQGRGPIRPSLCTESPQQRPAPPPGLAHLPFSE